MTNAPIFDLNTNRKNTFWWCRASRKTPFSWFVCRHFHSWFRRVGTWKPRFRDNMFQKIGSWEEYHRLGRASYELLINLKADEEVGMTNITEQLHSIDRLFEWELEHSRMADNWTARMHWVCGMEEGTHWIRFCLREIKRAIRRL